MRHFHSEADKSGGVTFHILSFVKWIKRQRRRTAMNEQNVLDEPAIVAFGEASGDPIKPSASWGSASLRRTSVLRSKTLAQAGFTPAEHV